jgi:hypothetical protein
MLVTVRCEWEHLGGQGDQWVLVSENRTVLASINEGADFTRVATGPLIEEGGHVFESVDEAKRAIENRAIVAGYEVLI